MTNLKNKNILVTGGAGFVGSNLVETLVKKHGANVTVLDDLFTGDPANLAQVEHQFVLGSVEDPDLVTECVQGKDIVFHLAAHNIIISNNNPREDLYINVGGSFNVFEASLKHKVQRVVYSSTSSVYGNPKKLPIEENDDKKFLNFYSASKYSAEVYAKTFFEVFQLPITIIRYSNVYGPKQSSSNPYCGVIGKFIESALNGEPLLVHGDGKQTRDYTFIDDAVTATIAAAVSPSAIGRDYNIGTGHETSVIDLARSILHNTGSSSTIRHIENRDIDNIRHRVIDISKSVNELGYKPDFTIEKGLNETVRWYIEFLSKLSTGIYASATL